MAYNALNVKNKSAGPGSSLRVTPSNSPNLRPPPRTPNKSPLHQGTLSLQTVIGTTTTTPNGFSSHDQSRSFAFCAGSAAVLAEVDEEGEVNQRFFRARPSVPSINPATSFYNQSTPPTTPDTRAKPLSSLKSAPNANVHNGSPSSELAESTAPRPWSSRERVKAVTGVSISPNGRLLAVGETGYSPRVLIFSTANDAPSDVPLSIMNDHTFGVRSLAFSSNSLHLATLGDANDGFLFVWSINPKNGAAQLHSTNKCTAHIRDMCWMGQTLITAGVRHVKIWRLADARPGSPSPNVTPKALAGRNCLLGALAESTFTSVASVSDTGAVVGTDKGSLCFIDDHAGAQKLTLVQHMGFGITSLAVDSDRSCIWIGGRDGQIQSVPLSMVENSLPPPSPTHSESSFLTECHHKKPAISCMGYLTSHLVTLDVTRAIHVYPVDALSDNDDLDHMANSIPGYRDAVMGVRSLQSPNHPDVDFFTWSSRGTVDFWDTRGRNQMTQTVPLEASGIGEESSNELKVLRTTENTDLFVAGDKFGVLRTMDGKTWRCTNEARAHGGEITDIALHPAFGSCLVASCGRDRMVQLFQKSDEDFQLIQTMDDHVGAVNQLLFINDGELLLSGSADRTIRVRNRVTREDNGATAIAYLVSKVITLKASPVSMALSPEDANILVVSTIDRCVQQYDISTGRLLHSFRSADSDSSDTVIMGALTVTEEVPGQSPKLLVGMSGTDKSIRLYDIERGALLTGEFGHTEGVSDICVLERESCSPDQPAIRTIISSGIDGIVMIWDVSVQPLQSQDRTDEDVPSKEPSVSNPPLRKLLSRSELAGFNRPENLPGTPTPVREHSPPLARKPSKLSLAPPSGKHYHSLPTTPPYTSSNRSSTSSHRFEKQHRSPSPSSPRSALGRKSKHTNIAARHSPRELRARPRSSNRSDFGNLDTSTDQVCRTLRAYRKKLNGSTDSLYSQKELERELNLTLRILASRTKACDSADAETDSSGKENEKLAVPTPNRPARRMPSTPNLGQRESQKVLRSHSFDSKAV
ncbi:hypothetical protein P170DRAFT_447702 [Aspergillus steynii IBT 23096]|uniref:Uncharacterized protein n=1 Tax=Aspergillus steynii IBT 23096 TaxID=1392250 RepID=A0A2I2G4K7_9EURO|nr:uncharacterized protein P170DRAFT_447702 [Aspergillus steynii IBT 23096]PLB47812.1 hypothetical protein P170DRAFT_447702 [Aspergillus steynii IBT 23096]